MKTPRWYLFALLLALAGFVCATPATAASSTQSLDAGWRLWVDTQAAWQDDTLYLPSEVHLARLPVNPPTGGWSALNPNAGISVTLPSTVEEHYWGKFGLRPYTGDVAAIRNQDPGLQNGSYQGVSWWWRTISPPRLKAGQRLIVHLRGTRLRSEIYCNGKLCGYSIMTELPLDADVTDAVQSGKPATLAIRITNPGGILDWNDFVPEHFFRWGKYTFPMSHGFGGLDAGVTLSARDNVAVSDLAAINTPDPHRIHLIAEVKSLSQPYAGPLHLQIRRADGQDSLPVWADSLPVRLRAGETNTIALDAHVTGARPWSLEHPVLYEASARLGESSGATSGRQTDFGFRFFTASGVGNLRDPYLTLNNRRIVVRSAISWGYWGRNGLWPDDEMARREVTAAKALGLNCLNFHRNIGKPAVLDMQDRMGLLRYEEPGSGAAAWGDRYDVPTGATFDAKPGSAVAPDDTDTSGQGPDGDAVEFWEKYEEEKILEMVRRDRSHPSLVMYAVQNEGAGNDLRNPRVYRIFREMHALDPSRIIVAHSGTSAHRAQALMLPYSDRITHASTSDAWGGWHDQHSVGGPGNYTPELYTDPSHYSQRPDYAGINDSTGAINMWGEMLGVGTPDNFQRLVASFDAKHPTGYDLNDDKRILAATHGFLDRWGFRGVFPTDSDYYTAIGNKSYFFWQKVMEQARADNANDYLAISGWESTTIDNFSGIVDNHRFFKGDPAVLRRGMLPEMLVVRPRRLVVGKGQPDLIDVFLVNEVGRFGPHTLQVTVRRPDGTTVMTVRKTVTATGDNTYGELLAEAIPFTADTAGMLRVGATLTPDNGANVKTSLTRDEQVNVIDPLPGNRGASQPRVAVLERGQGLTTALTDVLHLSPTTYHPGAPQDPAPDVIVLASAGGDPDFDALAGPPTPQGGGAGRTMDAALAQVKSDGTCLVLWGNGERSARWMLQELAYRKIVTIDSWVGHTGASWFGSWYFVHAHPLFNGLPTGVMDWRYANAWQPVHEEGDDSSTGGAVISAPGLEVACGYSKSETRTLIGASACVIPYGKGKVIWYCLPQLLEALTKEGLATDTAVAQRLLANAIYLPGRPQK